MLKILEGSTAQVPPQGGRKHPQQEYLQIDTTNILFIVGGAFDGLEEIIVNRLGESSVGFNAKVKSSSTENIDVFSKVEPQDFIKYGLIPEFVGRLPVITSVDELDKEALIEVLTKPKNALVKQFQKVFELDNVELSFTAGALESIAELAMNRKTGARGLRSILEDTLLDVMYESPSREDIQKIVVSKETVIDKLPPKMVITQEEDTDTSKQA